jgi:ABC-type cobalamin/Fe3+-siderophores transport system ATPase subunit
MAMSLTQSDLQEIRTIVRDEVTRAVTPLEGRLEALENDIKEIYTMLKDLQGSAITDKNFRKLSLKKRLLTINAELLATAKDAGVTLPRP